MTNRSSKKRSLKPKRPEGISHILLVHYHEIGLKGRNRGYFESLLRQNIQRRLADTYYGDKPLADAYPGEPDAPDGFDAPVGSEAPGGSDAPGSLSQPPPVQRISGRLMVTLDSAQDAVELAPVLAEVPGVVRVSTGLRLPQDLPTIYEAALGLMREAEPFLSFKVSARRSNTDFTPDSMQLNQLLGGYLHDRLPGKQVLMHDPDVTVHLELVESSAFLYIDSRRGVGGLPLGSAGSVVSLLSAGIDSPVATWRIMRRGAEVIGLHFSGRPETTDSSEHLVRQIAGCLEPAGGLQSLAVVAFGSYQRKIAEAVPASLRVVFYRRLMFATAERLAAQQGAKAIVTGESLGQVASQTLDNIRAVNAAISLPVLRPLIGSDKQEIIAEAVRLGSFDISTQSHDDCCTLFMPRNPETHANLTEVERIWGELPIEEWLLAIMDGMEFPAIR